MRERPGREGGGAHGARGGGHGACFQKVALERAAFEPPQLPPPELPELVFAGRSNVGKSSLLNRLFGTRKLVRVSGRPGFTSSINFYSVADRFRCVDLPGYGYARVPARERRRWQGLIEAYLRGRGGAIRCVVCILDIRRRPDQLDVGLFAYLKELGLEMAAVVNKADKLPQPRRRRALAAIEALLPPLRHPIFTVSARTGEGVEELAYFLCRLVEDEGR